MVGNEDCLYSGKTFHIIGIDFIIRLQFLTQAWYWQTPNCTFCPIKVVSSRLASTMACSFSYSAGLYFELPRPFFNLTVSFSAWMKANDMAELGSSESWEIVSLLMFEVKSLCWVQQRKQFRWMQRRSTNCAVMHCRGNSEMTQLWLQETGE